MKPIVFWIGMFSFCSCMQKNIEPVAEVVTEIVKEAQEADTVDVDFIMGKFEPKDHKDFALIDIKYADREGLYMQSQAYESFKEMYASASRAGIKLVIRSAARNFEYQKGIWERKWAAIKEEVSDKSRALKILEYSSMPGSSRHHWGTDIDLNSFENSWFESGEGLKLYNWMLENASTFGYCQPYTEKNEERPDGYNEEKWHWSYVPLSQTLTLQAADHLHDEMISGFEGASSADGIGVVKKYVLGINKNCK